MYYLRVIIIEFFFLLLILNCQNKSIENNAIMQDWKNIKNQSLSSRIWRKYEFVKRMTISKNDYKLYNPMKLFIDNKKNIYVFDYSIMKIIKFDSLGNFEKLFGKGMGKGPEEFISITGIDIVNDTLAILDHRQNKIVIYNTSGTFISIKKIKEVAFRFTLLNDKIITLPTYFDDKNFLNVYNNNSKILFKLIGPISFSKLNGNLLLSDGYLVSDDKSMIFFTFSRMGVIFSIDINNKKIVYCKKTIDAIPPPGVIQTGKGIYKIRDKVVSCISLCVDETSEKLYIYTVLVDSQNRYVPIIDTYELYSGHYLYSFKIPVKNVKDIKIYADNMYILHEFDVSVFKLKKQQKSISNFTYKSVNSKRETKYVKVRQYLDGALLSTKPGTIIYSAGKGVVDTIFSTQNNDFINYTVIIRDSIFKYTYSQLESVYIDMYQKIEKSTKIGKTIDSLWYFAIKKDFGN